MKRILFWSTISVLLAWFILSGFVLYTSHNQTSDANTEFENFIEIFRSTDYNSEILQIYNSDPRYNFQIQDTQDEYHLVMNYKIHNEVLNIELEKALCADIIKQH